MNIDKDIKELKAGLTDDAVIRQTIDTIKFYKNMDNLEKVPIDILRGLYKDALEELKTYKKIVKKWAEHIDFCPNNFEITKCEDYDNNCAKCRLEYARKEVLKDE